MWQAPPSNRIKINVDASFVKSISAGGVLLLWLGIPLETSSFRLGTLLGCAPVWTKRSFGRAWLVFISTFLFTCLLFLETDCAFVTSFLANENLDRSSLVDMKKEALSIIHRTLEAK